MRNRVRLSGIFTVTRDLAVRVGDELRREHRGRAEVLARLDDAPSADARDGRALAAHPAAPDADAVADAACRAAGCVVEAPALEPGVAGELVAGVAGRGRASTRVRVPC